MTNLSNTPNPGDLRSLWQTMPATPVTITAEEMRLRATAFQRKVSRRNYIEYSAAAFVIIVFGWYATWPIPATPLWPIANILCALGVLCGVYNLHRYAAAVAPTADSVPSLIDFHRAELVRQRNALATVWRWYILPVIPGLLLWLIAIWIGSPPERQARLAAPLIAVALICMLVFGLIILLNLLGAARLQRMIDDLERYKEKE